ncbi:DUF2062 domain-containing protein [Phragmitibacter flavus]|uniref:DUF2062 domain-containing protein n=1 Tax=Phragmitibacter flavus TaxID=2576071 RepID=A0A5R8KAY2_9BACT|nr:DUF2062 domain-containing protein [Phragmitibacter flavus]TLD69472.1 DUF2062 domain-containing protein [Phragmitibacter flavus]
MKERYLWLVKKSFRALRHRKLRRHVWWQKLTKPLFDRALWVPCRDSVAKGLAIGSFFALMPMPGQALMASILAMGWRGNVPFAVGACFLTNPFTSVPIWSAQMWLGNLIQAHLTVPMPAILNRMETTLPGLGQVNAGGFVVGSVASGCLMALAAFVLTHGFALLMPRYLPTRPLFKRRREQVASEVSVIKG